MKRAIYAVLGALMMTKLIYDMSSIHDLVVALESIGLALMAVALHGALKRTGGRE